MKIALVGYGRMGRALQELASSQGDEVVARITAADNHDGRGLTRENLAGAEVAVEFTAPEAAVDNIRALAASGIDIVVGTTGWYARLSEVSEAVARAGIGLIYAPNYSLGVQLFFRLARLAAQLGNHVEDYDVHLLEAHHRHKLDQPSGTARALAELILSEFQRKKSWQLGPGGAGPVDPSVLQVNAIRAGEIPGVHSLTLTGPDDQIELRHEARGRMGFARGALAAADWVRGRKGIFTLEDMLAEQWR